jgi:hypothetical protein
VLTTLTQAQLGTDGHPEAENPVSMLEALK